MFNGKIIKDLDPEHNGRLPVIPQVLTRRADFFIAAARALEQMGYREINWNLGCPHPQVVGKGLGAGLVATPQIVEQVLSEVFADRTIGVSVKVRLGVDDPGQLEALLVTLNRFALDKIIIHPRTAAQMYRGEVQLIPFERCLAAADHPVVFNGDIRNAADLARLRKKFDRVTGWMIGRGALADPWLAQAIKTGVPVPEPQRLPKLREFHQRLFEHYRTRLSGDAHLLHKMRSIWQYMAPAVPNAKKFAKKIQRASSIRTYNRTIEQFLVHTSRPA